MKKTLLWLLVLAVSISMLVSFSLAGCKKEEAPAEEEAVEVEEEEAAEEAAPTEEEAAEEEAPAEEIDTEGTITMGENHIYRSMDPIIMESSIERSLINSIYEGLTAYNKDNPGEWLPALAESWDVNDDASEWIFYLRKGIKFTTGNEMTAEDVVYSIARGINQNSLAYPPIGQFIDPDKGFEIVDDYTIKMTLLEGFAGWLSLLSLPACGILDKTELEKHITDDDPVGAGWLNDNSIGTGPFYLKEWVRNERIVLERNDNYWGIEAGYHRVPKYKTFISLNVQEPTTQQMMLEKGDIDFTKELSKDIAALLEDNQDIRIETNLAFIMTGLLMNLDFEPFADINVRHAIQYAIDYDIICSEVLSAIRCDRPIYKPAIGTDDDILYGYDLDKAKQLIAESNYPDGFEVSLCIGSGVGLGAEWEVLGLVLQSDLAKIGIIVSLEQYDWAAIDEKSFQGNYEALLNWVGPYFADTAGHVGDYMPDAYYFGNTGWENEEANRLADEAMKEPDMDKRYELYRELSELYAEEATVAFIAQEVRNVAFRSNIYGWDGNPDAYQCDYAVLYRK